MTAPSFEGTVAAVIGHGDHAHRAIAVALAEAGADVAIATMERTQTEEYGANSIANEIWAIGRQHFVRQMNVADRADVVAFAAEVPSRLKACDVVVTVAPTDPKALFEAFAPQLEQRPNSVFVVATLGGPRLPAVEGAAFSVIIRVIEELEHSDIVNAVLSVRN